MTNFNYDILRVVDTLPNVQAALINKQFGFETTNNRIVVKDAAGAFHYFKTAGDTDIIIDDNTADAFRVREDVNDYHNIDTTDGTEIMSFGNVSISPEYRYLGTGKFGIGVTPAQKFEIGSNDNSNRISIYHDNTDAYFTWDDGSLTLKTAEASFTLVKIQGATGQDATLNVYDENDDEWVSITCAGGRGRIFVGGGSPGNLSLYETAEGNIRCFESAADGETPYFGVSGRKSGGILDEIQIAVGEHIDQAASFFGCAGGYYFDNKVIFTQVDGNEYIDSETDGDMDYVATNTHHFSVGGTSNVFTISASTITMAQGATFHENQVRHSNGETDLGTGAVDWATADAAQDSAAQKSRVDVGATSGNNYYSLSGLVDGQTLYIFNTGTEVAYVGAAGSGSENMAIDADKCGVCVYISATTNLYAAT